jgi:hypothetical protein
MRFPTFRIPAFLRPLSLGEEIDRALKENHRATLETQLAIHALEGKMETLRLQYATLSSYPREGANLEGPRLRRVHRVRSSNPGG